MKRTATLYVEHKDPDGWFYLLNDLEPDELAQKTLREKFLEFGEQGFLEIVIDEDMNVVGGRVLPRLR